MADNGTDLFDRYQLFIIAGTIKAATSSLFNSINAHPQVCGSSVKETFFFSRDYSGDISADKKKYGAYFAVQPDSSVIFEASPNYLAYLENVAPRIKKLAPQAKFLFVLREPAERLYSHFNFARAKLELPEKMTFEQYVEACELYNAGEPTANTGVREAHLRALEIGNYGPYLQNFYDEFDEKNIRVIFFDDIKKQPKKVLLEICQYLGIDPAFYQQSGMKKANVTFSSKRKGLHIAAMLFNRLFESFLRRHPALKQRLVTIYKHFNQKQQGYQPMLESTRDKLESYYAPSNEKLRQMLKSAALPDWLSAQ
jgi:hypothetical protein